MPKKGRQRVKSELSFLLICTASIILLIISMANLKAFFVPRKTRNDLGAFYEQKRFWEAIVAQHPEYLDGWVELVKISIKLEDRQTALFAITSALEINPNLEKVAALKDKL